MNAFSLNWVQDVVVTIVISDIECGAILLCFIEDRVGCLIRVLVIQTVYGVIRVTVAVESQGVQWL